MHIESPDTTNAPRRAEEVCGAPVLRRPSHCQEMADFTAEEILNDLNQGAYDDETAELAQRAIAQDDEDVLDTLLAPGLTRGAMTSFGLGDDDVSAIASTLYMDPSAPFPDPDPVDCSNLDLYTEKHSVHMVIGEGDAKEYVVSNIRDFSITVMLQDRFTQGLSNYELRLKASVLYENSMPVRASPGESTLLGPKQSTNTEVTIKGGRATFTLRMGVGTLSKKHDNQRFRIKIEPVDEQLSTAYPTLTQLTEPLKSVTKLQRSTPHAANSAPAARASQQQQQQQQQGFGAIPNYGDALPLPLPMPSSGIPAPAAGAASGAVRGRCCQHRARTTGRSGRRHWQQQLAVWPARHPAGLRARVDLRTVGHGCARCGDAAWARPACRRLGKQHY